MALSFDERLDLAVIEREDRVGVHQTGHNSGVIHSGLYYAPGSLKARLCVQGRDALYRFCEEHDIAVERCGKLVVATTEDELPRLNELHRRGSANGLVNLALLSQDEIRDYEPNVVGHTALHVRESGIVDFVKVAEAMAGVITTSGGDVILGTTATDAIIEHNLIRLRTTRGEIRCRYLINCAGAHADRVASRCGVTPTVRIIPFRGVYYEVVPERRELVRNLVYPVPDPQYPFLGVHFTRMIDGRVEAGPTAVLALKRDGYARYSASLADIASTISYPGFWRMARVHWRTGVGEIMRSFNKSAFVAAAQWLIPELDESDLRLSVSGVRAQAVERDGSLTDDFRIVEGERSIHVLNAPSPAATAAISIGEEIADLARRSFDLL